MSEVRFPGGSQGDAVRPDDVMIPPSAVDRPEGPSGPAQESIPSSPVDPPVLPLLGPLAVYTVLRLALVAVLTVVLALFMPWIVALLFAVIVQLPLAWVLFGRFRRRVNEAIAARTAHRRAERERLRQALAGR